MDLTDSELRETQIMNGTASREQLYEKIKELEEEIKTLTHTNKSYKGKLQEQGNDISRLQKEIEKLEKREEKIIKGEIPVVSPYYPDKYVLPEMEYMERKRLEEENGRLRERIKELENG